MSKSFKTSSYNNRLKKSKIKYWNINPKGKLVLPPFVLCPSYQDITLVKAQIKWHEKTARYYLKENFDYFFLNKI
jgi:thiosulfate reductase cytochrome b subunit